MARVNQVNPWGRSKGMEPQRLDLWAIGLSNVIQAINRAIFDSTSDKSALKLLPDIPAYFAMQVSLPELRVRPDTFRRDSRPYQMPAWDDPLDPIKVVFVLDAGSDTESSIIYRVLDAWRAMVRAGRGSMSNGFNKSQGSAGEQFVALNATYSMDYTFNVPVTLLKGAAPVVNSTRLAQERAFANMGTAQTQSRNAFNAQQKFNEGLKLLGFSALTQAQDASQLASDSQNASARANAFNSTGQSGGDDTIKNDLQTSGQYLLVGAWLGGFRMSDLIYAQNGLVTLEATLYAEDVVDKSQKTNRQDFTLSTP